MNVNQMGVGYGGLSYPEIHPTKIKQESGYLGPHPCIFKPGQVHYLLFQYNNNGPFWMTPEEREFKRHSQFDEPTNAAKAKADLLRDLQKAGISMNGFKGKRVGDLQDLATMIDFVTVNCVLKDRVK